MFIEREHVGKIIESMSNPNNYYVKKNIRSKIFIHDVVTWT